MGWWVFLFDIWWVYILRIRYFEKHGNSSAEKEINWFFYNSVVTNILNQGPILYGGLTSVWAIVHFYDQPTTQAPYFALYTPKTGWPPTFYVLVIWSSYYF